MARGGADRGRTFGTYLRLRAQKPLSGFCSRPVLGGGTAVEQPGRERCSAARRRRSLEQRRPNPAFGRRRRSRDRESMQCRSMNLGIVKTCKAAGTCARATCSFCDSTATSLRDDATHKDLGPKQPSSNDVLPAFFTTRHGFASQCATHHYTSWFCVTKLAF